MLVKATTGWPPSTAIEGSNELELAIAPSGPSARSTSRVVPLTRSRTNTWSVVPPAPAVRFDALLEKATKRPSGLIEGEAEVPFAPAPAGPWRGSRDA